MSNDDDDRQQNEYFVCVCVLCVFVENRLVYGEFTRFIVLRG
jgi:hypothetical protein